MSKGYASALALIEAGKQMAVNMKTSPKKEEKKPPTLEELWVKEMQRRAQFDEFMKMQKKMGEDDKKKKNSPFDTTSIALFLIASSPLTGPLYVWWFRTMLGG